MQVCYLTDSLTELKFGRFYVRRGAELSPIPNSAAERVQRCICAVQCQITSPGFPEGEPGKLFRISGSTRALQMLHMPEEGEPSKGLTLRQWDIGNKL